VDLAEVIDFYKKLPEVEESTPFGPHILVYKVCNKMFATASLDDVPARINLKCNPDKSLDLRDQYEAIIPGYHMNKKHWNTLSLDGSLSNTLISELIEHSYDLVVDRLNKTDRNRLQSQRGTK